MANHIYTALRYRDARAAIDFLREAFGFELHASHEDDEGGIQHVEMRWGDSMIMFGEENEHSIALAGSHAGQGWTYVTVDAPDAHHERAKAAGAKITGELTDQDYGSRDYSAEDPEGNSWNFGTYDPLAG